MICCIGTKRLSRTGKNARRKKVLLGASRHIAGIVNPPANKKYGFYHNLDFNEHPEAWFKNAKYRHGSWWPEWIKWLKVKSDEITPSPNLNTLAFQSLLDAPGSYVHQSYKPS